MLLYQSPHFTIYFGNACDGIYPDQGSLRAVPQYIYEVPDSRTLLTFESFARLKKTTGIESLVFLHQVHGVKGKIIDAGNIDTFRPFSVDGDYLITQSKAGIGVMTADCVPLVLYDAGNHAVAVVHAGWRGTVNGVALQAVRHMQQEWGTQRENLRVIFGPSARSCCYQVTQEFNEHLAPYAWGHQTLTLRNNQLFFDNVLLNQLQLQEYGLKDTAFCHDYALCTICDPSFYSYRRQKEKAGRQMTVVCLK